ncbi:MAG: hypothetical protein CTY25_05665 [Methylobacterium sp.]|nr:MAG: hypothetical protein CTY25_05665 [Methylobacterium sp.]
MTQNPRTPNPIENEDEENLAFHEKTQGLDNLRDERAVQPNARFATDDPMDLEDAVAALDADEPEELGSGEDHERIPDRTQQRGYR